MNSEYKRVPAHLKDDNVIPSVSELPSIITSIRHPRKRAVSIGPQSAADAWETLAYREKRRRESVSSTGAVSSDVIIQPSARVDLGPDDNYFPILASDEESGSYGVSTMSKPLPAIGSLQSSTTSRVDSYEKMMGQGTSPYIPPTQSTGPSENSRMSATGSEVQRQEEREEREMFSKLEKLRVRYDVEVVTKLIVYAGKLPKYHFSNMYNLLIKCRVNSGIAFLAVEGNPILFEITGLGMTMQKS